jgi:hypothetical protein
VYDAWGTTVQHAADLARMGGVGTTFVSRAVQAQLPATFMVEGAAPDGDLAVGASVVTGRTRNEEPVR